MRQLIILCLCCCCCAGGLLAEETVELPVSYLKFLQIPLLDDQQGPSDQLATLLRLSDVERGELATAFKDFRQDLLDRMVAQATVSVAEADHVEATIPPMGSALADIKRVFDMRVRNLLGEERVALFEAMRPKVHTWGNRVHETKEDRVIDALTDDFELNGQMETHMTMKREGQGWSRTYERRTPDGDRRGSSSSSGGDLDAFEQLVFDHLLSKGAAKSEGGAAPEF